MSVQGAMIPRGENFVGSAGRVAAWLAGAAGGRGCESNAGSDDTENDGAHIIGMITRDSICA